MQFNVSGNVEGGTLERQEGTQENLPHTFLKAVPTIWVDSGMNGVCKNSSYRFEVCSCICFYSCNTKRERGGEGAGPNHIP